MSTRTEAADLLRSLLDEVKAGRLVAPGSIGARLLRRMEGAAVALEASGSKPRRRASRRRAP